MGRISLINDLLLIFQENEEDIINTKQAAIMSTKKVIIKLQNYIKDLQWSVLLPGTPRFSYAFDLSKNVRQFPFDHFSIRVHNKLLTRVEDCKIPAVNCCTLLFPKGKLVSVLYFTVCHVKQISFMSKTGNNKEASKKKKKITRLWRYRSICIHFSR